MKPLSRKQEYYHTTTRAPENTYKISHSFAFYFVFMTQFAGKKSCCNKCDTAFSVNGFLLFVKPKEILFSKFEITTSRTAYIFNMETSILCDT